MMFFSQHSHCKRCGKRKHSTKRKDSQPYKKKSHHIYGVLLQIEESCILIETEEAIMSVPFKNISKIMCKKPHNNCHSHHEHDCHHCPKKCWKQKHMAVGRCWRATESAAHPKTSKNESSSSAESSSRSENSFNESSIHPIWIQVISSNLSKQPLWRNHESSSFSEKSKKHHRSFKKRCYKCKSHKSSLKKLHYLIGEELKISTNNLL